MPKGAPRPIDAAYRPELRAALEILALASRDLMARGLPAPVLVGGAAFELYAGSPADLNAVTGDLDLAAVDQEAVEDALVAYGFRRPGRRPGEPRRGVVHDELAFGAEVVAESLDPARAEIVAFGSGLLRVISREDLVVDRVLQATFPVGEFPPSYGNSRARLGQAALLWHLHKEALDRDYLSKRLAGEIPDVSLERFIAAAEAYLAATDLVGGRSR